MDVLLRALAIAAITYHHAHLLDTGPFGLAGGMTFLMMLSGVNFARFAVRGADPERVRHSIAGFATQVFVPSMGLVLLSFAAYGEFSWLELLFVRNWYDTKHIAAFYNWYPQLLLQLLALLYGLFSIPRLARAMLAHPARSMLLLFAAGLALRWAAPFVWDTSYLRHRLPHTFLWNFALGAAVYFLALDGSKVSRQSKGLAFLCILAGAAVAHDAARLAFWWLAIGGACLVYVRQVRLPALAAGTVVVVSARAFGIFLTHLIWFKVLSRLNELRAGADAVVHPDLHFAFGLIMGTLTWVVCTAFGRAYRAVRVQPAAVGYAQ
jgi:hypothetical protein